MIPIFGKIGQFFQDLGHGIASGFQNGLDSIFSAVNQGVHAIIHKTLSVLLIGDQRLHRRNIASTTSSSRPASMSTSTRTSNVTHTRNDVPFNQHSNQQSTLLGFASSTTLSTEHFIFGRKLGTGGFGSVFSATCKNESRKIVAIKRINNCSSQSMKEVAIHQKVCGHRNIVDVYGSFVEDRALHVVMEHVRGMDVCKLIMKKGGIIEKDALGIMYQVCCAIRHVHSMGVSHLDLKPENIMLTRCVQTGRICVRIIDFGMACLSPNGGPHDNILYSGMRGTVCYSAPEMVFSRLYCGKKADVWSLGMVLYVLLSGHMFVNGRSFREVAESLYRYGVPNFHVDRHLRGVSSELKDLVQVMLEIDPRHRPSVHEVCRIIRPMRYTDRQ